MDNSLYFIGLLPPAPLQQAINGFKQEAADHFNARHAFRSPPHITLQPPFSWSKAELPKLLDGLKAFAGEIAVFEITFRDFHHFAPRVIYVDVVPSEALTALRQRLLQLTEDQFSIVEKHKNSPFFPHATIAFRDLKRKDFTAAWAHFAGKRYEATFAAKALYLFEHEAAHGWHVAHELPFGE